MGNYRHVDGRSCFQNAIDGADDPNLGGARRLPSSNASVRVVAQWSLTSLREKLELFEEILRLVDGLRRRPAPA
jgi:hypothetical protein